MALTFLGGTIYLALIKDNLEKAMKIWPLGLNEYRNPEKLRLINLFLIPYDQKALVYAQANNKEEVILKKEEDDSSQWTSSF